MLFTTPAQALDPYAFSVKVNKFSPEVFSQNKSEFTVYSSDTAFTLPETPFQKVTTQSQKKGMLLHVTAGTYTKGNLSSALSKRYLRDSAFLNLTSKQVQFMAAQLRGSKDPIASVEQKVYYHINNKVLGIPLLPAKNIIAGRSGDCTEHSILSIALLRSLNIPCRAAVGMILVPEFLGAKNVFVYHMWVEAYYRGKWHLVDATRPGRKQHNRYITLAYHSLQTAMPLSYFSAIGAISNLKITYVK
jgi:transglutaminase-like putative cysteine protease